MMVKKTLKDKVLFITGGSRGIGREIALRAAQEGAKVVIAAKTDQPHPKLPGTIYTVAREIERLGGQALPLVLDVRNELMIESAVSEIVNYWGGIDILVNNASAISMTSTSETPAKRFDLIFSVNVRGTFLCSRACLSYLKKSDNPHILNLAPPLDMNAKWFRDHLAYTMSKYGMSMCTLGMAEEFRKEGIAVNSLWPKTTIATAAIAVNFPAEVYQASRKPAIVADAAHVILTGNSREMTGRFFIDEEVLQAEGCRDFSGYSVTPGMPLFPDLFVES